MSRRFINCKACGGCHTGRGGQFCPFVSPGGTKLEIAPSSDTMLAPDRDSPQYESYLAERIEEEEERLKILKDKCRVATMEEQLARLRLQTSELDKKSLSDRDDLLKPDTGDGVASKLLTAVTRGAAASPQSPRPASSASVFTPQRPKEEKEMLSKLQALAYLPEQKAIEKITYRDYICAMTKVLKVLTELGIDPSQYAAHMSFVTSKAALNLYATDALIRYDIAVTERVISGQYADTVAADPECVALHLGADATYAVRQGGSRWTRNASSSFSSSRDFSEWPKEVCWLFNNTSCYFPRCKKAHICCKCKKTGHPMKECKSADDAHPPTGTESFIKSSKDIKKA